ncbi:hypothetical protein ACGFIF_20335 [Kribbella sp. NPDC049174]|uniref:hypothetical protein n=1 Tax=Kribbella sp. NPDC049174 TaxID=3364112 RepID=UPI00371B6126
MRPIRSTLAVLAAGGLLAWWAYPSAADQTTAAAAPVAPGPAVLNAPPPTAPQLENTGIWQAKPTMICHTSAYRAGEFLNQGCVYDDQGAQLVTTNWPEHSLTFAYTYPTDPAYRGNAADLVEVRVKPLADATAFRITFNTMTDPELVGTTIALGNSLLPREAPYGANTRMPAEKFVTVHGRTGDIIDAATGKKAPVTVAVDLERGQVEVRVPHTAYDPGTRSVRIAAAAGLWDRAANKFLLPQAVADATHPGGALTSGLLQKSAYFDVAFRQEPFNSPWRNDAQKTTLATGNISKFFATVDFGKLQQQVTDDSAVPTSGYMNRLYATKSEVRQGRRLPGDPGMPPLGSFTQQNGATINGEGTPSVQFGWICRDDCVSDLPGRLQRYLAYVPDLPKPANGYASMVWTPGYAQSANDQVGDPGMLELLPAGDRDLFHQVANRPSAPTVVISVDGRGNDNWYYGRSGTSVFEALADARRAFGLDPTRTVMSGFSSGAYGANKLSLQFPDVFSKAFICDGLNMAPSFPGINGIADTLPVDTATQHEPGSTLTPLLPSRRNQPVLEWAGLPDNYIPYNIPRERANAYLAGGQYDFKFDSWLGASSDHVVMCANATWGVLTDWLGDMRGVKDPFYVTYVRNPAMDDPESGLVGDHAYWLSDIQSRSGQLGTIDVQSHGFGLKDAPAAPVVTGAGVETGSTVPVNAYTTEHRTKPAPVSAPVANRLDITATNVRTVTIDPQQAKVTCAADLNVTTDGPLTVRLIGCPDHNFD